MYTQFLSAPRTGMLIFTELWLSYRHCPECVPWIVSLTHTHSIELGVSAFFSLSRYHTKAHRVEGTLFIATQVRKAAVGPHSKWA